MTQTSPVDFASLMPIAEKIAKAYNGFKTNPKTDSIVLTAEEASKLHEVLTYMSSELLRYRMEDVIIGLIMNVGQDPVENVPTGVTVQ